MDPGRHLLGTGDSRAKHFGSLASWTRPVGIWLDLVAARRSNLDSDAGSDGFLCYGADHRHALVRAQQSSLGHIHAAWITRCDVALRIQRGSVGEQRWVDVVAVGLLRRREQS